MLILIINISINVSIKDIRNRQEISSLYNEWKYEIIDNKWDNFELMIITKILNKVIWI